MDGSILHLACIRSSSSFTLTSSSFCQVSPLTFSLSQATVLTVSPRPHLLGQFWTYSTTTQPEFSTEQAQKRLSDRLGDVLLKQLTLIGAPQMLSALIPLAKVQTAGRGEEEPVEMDLEGWSQPSFPALHARGIETITTIYGTLWPTIFHSFGPHRRDIGLHELGIVYGLYLSDFRLLSPLETEVVAYTCITAQGLRGPALWHVRGLGRVLGARGADTNTKKPDIDTEETDRNQIRRIKLVLTGVKAAVVAAVQFCGAEMVMRSRLDAGWPDAEDVVRELGGWGDD
ncbi:hypothetical protein A1O1_04361 [Capronia coronata CBS 617.96]|uniref:Carboxymuconolactone decarboxylase-like domain-containing protein n=1 Tax=Capronia coronata CBS 617.96 TaxID=1182541 RepID=W9YPT0_9EURO|nr:uncharacterized protein A1O1_04361 [Capronia coronata CBS 617.96]EXJ91251.1 hypothetical protein A1O1_04361 [Capronia coronata CBS 617.96]